jgi:hypothetical protein
MVISLRLKLLLSPEHLRKWSLGSIPPPHPPDKQLSTQGIAVSREPLSGITKNDHRQTQAPSTIAEFDTSHSNFVYLPASIRSHNTCQTLEAVSPLRADLKSAIWPHAAGISRKVGTKAQVTASTRSLWQEQTEMVHRRKANPHPRKNFPRNKRSRSAPMKSISSATAPPATRWMTGSAPNASFSRNLANPPRKPPRPLLKSRLGLSAFIPRSRFPSLRTKQDGAFLPLRSSQAVARCSQLLHPRFAWFVLLALLRTSPQTFAGHSATMARLQNVLHI